MSNSAIQLLIPGIKFHTLEDAKENLHELVESLKVNDSYYHENQALSNASLGFLWNSGAITKTLESKERSRSNISLQSFSLDINFAKCFKNPHEVIFCLGYIRQSMIFDKLPNVAYKKAINSGLNVININPSEIIDLESFNYHKALYSGWQVFKREHSEILFFEIAEEKATPIFKSTPIFLTRKGPLIIVRKSNLRMSYKLKLIDKHLRSIILGTANSALTYNQELSILHVANFNGQSIEDILINEVL